MGFCTRSPGVRGRVRGAHEELCVAGAVVGRVADDDRLRARRRQLRQRQPEPVQQRSPPLRRAVLAEAVDILSVGDRRVDGVRGVGDVR